MSSLIDTHSCYTLMQYDCGVVVVGFYDRLSIGNIPTIIGFMNGSRNDRLKIMNLFCEAGCVPRIDSSGRWSVVNCFIGGTHAIQFSHKTGSIIPPDSTYRFKVVNKRGLLE